MIPILSSKVTAETFKNYIQRLAKDPKIKKIGESNGVVFQHPTDRRIVVKVFHDDLYYEKYLSWVAAHPQNKYAPKLFGSVHSLPDDDPGAGHIKIAFIEKLKPATLKDIAKGIAYVSELIASSKWAPSLPIKGWGSVAPDFMHLTQNQWRGLVEQRRDADMAAFAKFILSIDGHVDLHSKNVMKRGTQLVFPDPVT